MSVTPLLCSPSPRCIPEVRDNLDTIPCDKLLVKYHHTKRAYKIMRSYFLDNKEYTHLILSPDDLIVNESHYNKLKQVIEEHDYQVLSGVCNVSVNNQDLAVTIVNLPSPARRTRRSRKYIFAQPSSAQGIVRVLWAGFPFMWIRKDVVEKIEFEDDTRWNPQDPNKGWAFDVTFCYHCNRLGIPIYSDFDVVMRHLKDEGHLIKTGIEKPKVLQILGATNYQEQDITKYCNDKYLTEEDWQKYPHQNNRTQEVIYI